jgi:hypothetical protein
MPNRRCFCLIVALASSFAACNSGGSGADGSLGPSNGSEDGGGVGSGGDGGADGAAEPPPLVPPMGIMFVTSVPGAPFSGQLNTFANHGTSRQDAIAGGDLWIRYFDGTLRNLTKEAGWGVDTGGIQGGDKAISVRQPSMHWDGKKAIFSMLVGGPTARYELPQRQWQMYEVTGFAKGETVAITKVKDQPASYNNISPIYGTDDAILFVSDAPIFGLTNTYPQLDEYESALTNTGIWKLDPAGKVSHLEHAPSGVFDLFLDSFGRLLFTKWDHLKRDQQADADRFAGGTYGAVDFASETATSPKVFPATDANGKLIADAKGVLYDVFPEARVAQDPTRNANEELHDFNVFSIWQINEDGSEEETMNHAGRHEFAGGTFIPPAFTDDPNLTYIIPNFSKNAAIRDTLRPDAGLFQLREDIRHPGTYLTTYAMEFSRQAAGRILEFVMPPGTNPEDVVMTEHTNPTLDADPYGEAPALPTMTGHFRNPLRLTDGSLLASHTPEYRLNTTAHLYVLQLKPMVPNPNGKDMIAGASLTGGISKKILYWTDAATPVEYDGLLSEHDVIEVRSRTRPQTHKTAVPNVEKQVLTDEAVDEAELRTWLETRKLAVIVSRNVTLRDRADVQQPFNLRIAGGAENIVKPGKVYDIAGLQIVQGDLTRGYGNGSRDGRRVYARPVHDTTTHTDVASWYPAPAETGTVKLGTDGSMAAVVPAGRALSWQLVTTTGKPVVRERVWVSLAPGEIRACPSCHGLNKETGNGLTEPTNPPAAFRDLVRAWKARK